MRPPQHSINAVPVYILPDDSAWDIARIDRELDGLSDEDAEGHPYSVYQRGENRFDLNARVTWAKGEGSAKDYLSGDPIRFTLHRMSVAEMAEVQDTLSREIKREGANGSYTGVWLKSATYGIASIDGDPRLRFPAGHVPERVLQVIVDDYGGLASLTAIGLAAYKLTKPLTDAEKKR